MQPQNASQHVQFHRRWRPALMSFFLRRVHNHADAEDLTQEVFARLLGSGEAAERPAEAYVFQVAANLLRDQLRRAKVRADYRDALAGQDGQGIDWIDPARVAAARTAYATFAASLQALPKRTRDIFTLYRIENVSLDAIAESYGISHSAAKKHVIKAMAFLMARMREVK